MDDPVIEEARQARIAELEARVGRPASVGVRPFVALVGMGVAGYLAAHYAPDAQYFSSPKEAIALGAEGDYHFERLAHNRYAQVRGTPTARAAYGRIGEKTFVAVGLVESPVIVWRAALPTEQWKAGGAPPPPDKSAFTARGRLIAREQVPDRYASAFTRHDEINEVNAKWLLLDGERPGSDFAGAGLFAGLVALCALNAWLLVRGLAAWWRPKPVAT